MEWFIARKKRPVFDVYRSVFHHSIEGTFQFDGKKYFSQAEYCQM